MGQGSDQAEPGVALARMYLQLGSVAQGDVPEAASAGSARQEAVANTHCDCEIDHGRM